MAPCSRPAFVLLPGAGSTPWYWHRVERRLRALDYGVVAVHLPCEDDTAGLAEYADTVVTTVGEERDVVVVAHSFGAFTAPLVCGRLPVRALVLVAPMIPVAGESGSEWWGRTGQPEAQRDSALRDGRDPDAEPGLRELFLHDLPDDLANAALRHGECEQSSTPFEQPWPAPAWPDVPTRVVAFRHDRLFPPTFQHRIAGERLAVTPDEVDGGHMAMLGNPVELTHLLVSYNP
ncbi:alpha/beta fold hydrolase [Saccharomonospora cyanea]|uniref:Putative hydrolase or acyltransferase of alpha/beta superfamily n=1 Tax=Saccharomonospora cyanea NA-134 TaxID=882082 RepID=H5XRB8_9PSEU|nr:alpha/beta hydrolase [Saccharomonospora cyanea]EHR63399.1 putative hydrolase or acyltransferase of alpha/beta superfamily [Saccharomonospora cyanea NA-134]